MPTYSYKCTQCDNAFDIQQAFTDDTLVTCPVCGGKLRKVFSPVGVTFNGSGFYRTDSRAEKKTSEKSNSKSSSSSEAKSDKAPASKPADTAPKKADAPSGKKPSGSAGQGA